MTRVDLPRPPITARRGPSGRPVRGRLTRREAVAGYVFLTPWMLGLLAISAVPLVYSLYLSFTDNDLFGGGTWVGLRNYRQLFGQDEQYWHAVRDTAVFAGISVPLKLLAGLGVALLLFRRRRRGSSWLRAVLYLPSLLGTSVALAIAWQALFSGGGGVNRLLALVGIHGRSWTGEPDTALYTLILLAVWQFGAPMVVFLAGLSQIPVDYFESAAVDGAGAWRTFWTVTVPSLSPVIFFNLVLETISGFQGFTAAFVVSDGTGGPADSTLLYTLYLYMKGFGDFQMGYASSMAWVFLVVVGLLTLVMFGTGRLWVHYADDWGV